MNDDITQRLTVEGVDPLALAGVNDANLIELTKRLGVRVSLRGDSLTLQGPEAAVERASPVVQAMVDLARMGEELDVHDVERLLLEGQTGSLSEPGGAVQQEMKIILPGLRRVIGRASCRERV